jgi:hypothetical protein
MIRKNLKRNYLNNILSTVVLTQNNLCNIIPKIKLNISIIQKFKLNILEIIKANNIVRSKSTIAIFKNLIECTPVPTSPKIFL